MVWELDLAASLQAQLEEPLSQGGQQVLLGKVSEDLVDQGTLLKDL